MGIAHGESVALRVEIEGGLKGGKRNVVDDFCGSFGFVAAGYCDQLHGWRVHSYIARAGTGGAAIQHHKWPSNGHIRSEPTTVCPAGARIIAAQNDGFGRCKF
jgi:hypothetical protein